MLLVDKYSPQKIDEILGNSDVIQIVKDIKDDFPHLLFTGPPGTGKTTLAHLLKAGFETLELNASDERGIETVRVQLKGFCQRSIDRKLVILDECDNLTAAAQQALRRLMETTDARFILICNRVSEVIEPIQSRCAVLRFERVPTEEFRARLREISDLEGIKITEDGLDAVMNVSHGDIRASLGCLQGISGIGRVVDDEFIYKLNGVPNLKVLEEIIAGLKRKETARALEVFDELWSQGFESTDILDGFFRIGKSQDNYELLKVVGKYQLRVNEGVNSKLQFYGLFSELSKVLQ